MAAPWLLHKAASIGRLERRHVDDLTWNGLLHLLAGWFPCGNAISPADGNDPAAAFAVMVGSAVIILPLLILGALWLLLRGGASIVTGSIFPSAAIGLLPLALRALVAGADHDRFRMYQ
jgi:hypothetical protein